MSRWTRFGLATRAVAEDEQATALLGYAPQRIAAVNWVAATVLAALAGILVAPISALNPTTYTLLVVPALAAALIGRLSSFGVTVAAALGLGMVQSVLLPVQEDLPWLRQPGLRDGLPLLVIAVVVAVRGELVPGRGAAAAPAARLPRVAPAGRPLRALAVGVPPAVAALLVLSGPYRLGLARSLAGAVVCLSFVVLTGYVGQLSLAQMTLAGVAGFLLARLHTGLHVPFPLAPLLAAAVAGATGLLRLVSRRVRGVDLAVVTLAAGLAVQETVFANPAVTGGLAGSRVPPPIVFGIDLGLAGPGFPRPGYGLLALAVLAGCCYGVARLRAGAGGRRMLAVRANERAASAVGVDVARTKLVAFVLAAGLAGLGGCLIGYGQGQLSFESFGVSASLLFLAVAAVGGVTSVRGALLGGLLVPGGLAFTALDRLAGLGRYQLLLSGVALVAVVVLAPEGLARARGPRPLPAP